MMEWIENYIKDLVSLPDRVAVSVNKSVVVAVVHLKLAAEDRPLFDGRNNRLARALASVLVLASARDRVRYVLRIDH